jgi:uncharacterized membrane protein
VEYRSSRHSVRWALNTLTVIRRRALLLVLFLADTFLYSALSILRHRHFESGWDLAVFDQAIWLYSRFYSPDVTVRFNRPENILGDHFHPIVALLSPFCWIWNSAEAILIGQSFIVALSVIPVFLFTARRLGNGAAWLFALSYSLFWGVQETVEFGFHEIAFAIPLIAFAIYYNDVQKPWGYFTCFFLMLLTKENMGAILAFFGIYLLLLRRYRDGVLSLTLGAITFPLVTKIVIPFFSGRAYDYWTYDELGPDLIGAMKTMIRKPWLVPQIMTSPATKLHTMWLIFSPFLLVSLFSPLMILFVPIFAERFLSSRLVFWEPIYHYNATVTPVVAMAAADGLWRITRLVKSDRARKLSIQLAALTILIINLCMLPRLPLWKLISPDYWQLSERDRDGQAAVAMIPTGASVAAQIPIAPHLTHRRRIYVIHPPGIEAVPTGISYVIASSQLTAHPFGSYAEIEAFLVEQQEKGYVKIFDRNGWVVLKRAVVEPGKPLIVTEEGSGHVVALDSVTLTQVTSNRTPRLAVFAMNITSEHTDARSELEVTAQDEKGNVYAVELEAVIPLNRPTGMAQLNIRLPDQLSRSEHVWISIKSGDLTSNKGLLKLQPP